MRDTSPEAVAVQIAAFRRMSPAERVAAAFEASEFIMRVARARLGAVALLAAPSPNSVSTTETYSLPPSIPTSLAERCAALENPPPGRIQI